MRLRLIALLGFGMSVSGCTCTIDPESVKAPVACVSTGCTGKACGYNDCGYVCTQGTDLCEVTHSVVGGVVAGAGRTDAGTSNHKAQGEIVPAAGNSAAAGGHSITQGTLSR